MTPSDYTPIPALIRDILDSPQSLRNYFSHWRATFRFEWDQRTPFGRAVLLPWMGLTLVGVPVIYIYTLLMMLILSPFLTVMNVGKAVLIGVKRRLPPIYPEGEQA